MSWFAAFGGVALVLLWTWRARLLDRRSLLRLAGVGGCGLAAIAAFAEPIVRRITEIDPEMDTVVVRMQLNEVALNMIRARPLPSTGRSRASRKATRGTSCCSWACGSRRGVSSASVG
jgi:hypothetical protein